MAEPEDVEILAHIAAPCRASDDAHFRALASAYINFRPTTTTNLLDLPNDGSPTNPPAVKQTVALPEVQSSVSEALPFPSTGDSFASFESVWDNESPRLRVPANVVQDAVKASSSPTRALKHLLSDSTRNVDESSSSDLPTARTPTSSEGPGQTGEVVIPRTSSSDLLKGALPSVADTGASSGDAIQSSSLPGQSDALSALEASGIPDMEDQALHLPWQHVPSKRHFAASGRSDSEPLMRKRQRLVDEAVESHAMSRRSSDVGAMKGATKLGNTPPPTTAARLAASIEVWAPEPPVTANHLESAQLVTKSLQKLAKDLAIEKRFRPAVQKRPLRPFERGYWAVDCSTWGEELSQSAWVFLTNYVANGHAGWGVWCRRAEDWSCIRVYCWGAVVGHVYLLLYMVSQRKILSTGGSWIGGDGDPLVVLGIKKT